MRPFVHLGDLHLGIKFHKRSLISDQKLALDEIADWVVRNDANLIIAGDVFDTVSPPVAAQELWYDFLLKVGSHNKVIQTDTYVIPGNHDSAARLGLAAPFFEASRIHILDKNEAYQVFTLTDGYRLFCVPFLKPSLLEAKLGETAETYDEAYQKLIAKMDESYHIDDKSILVAHQTFEGGQTGESEFKPFMSDAVSQKTVFMFNKVISGHLHGRQSIGNIVYSGSLLPYAFGDDYHQSFLSWDLEKGTYEEIPLQISHNLTVIEGDLSHCLAQSCPNDYVKVKLKGCLHFEDALSRLQERFPLLCCVTTDATDTWEADLNKELQAFSTVQEALDAFCAHLEIPEFEGLKKQKIQEALDAFTDSQN